jgi:hypothetical protein
MGIPAFVPRFTIAATLLCGACLADDCDEARFATTELVDMTRLSGSESVNSPRSFQGRRSIWRTEIGRSIGLRLPSARFRYRNTDTLVSEASYRSCSAAGGPCCVQAGVEDRFQDQCSRPVFKTVQANLTWRAPFAEPRCYLAIDHVGNAASICRAERGSGDRRSRYVTFLRSMGAPAPLAWEKEPEAFRQVRFDAWGRTTRRRWRQRPLAPSGWSRHTRQRRFAVAATCRLSRN